MTSFFFDGWQPILRTLIVGVLAYAALIVTLRVSGKRTLSKMNAFDFIVTVALGSTLATVLLSKDVSLLQGIVALSLLVFLQWVVAFGAVRWRLVDEMVKSEPRLLVHRGQLLPKAMRKERVTVGEVMTALRREGLDSPEEADAVVLETDGSVSVVPNAKEGAAVLAGMPRFDGEDASGHEAQA